MLSLSELVAVGKLHDPVAYDYQGLLLTDDGSMKENEPGVLG